MIIIYNWLGAAMVAFGVVMGLSLSVGIGPVVGWSVGIVVAGLCDFGYRASKCRFASAGERAVQFIMPSGGGQLFFIPVWGLALAALVTGASIGIVGATGDENEQSEPDEHDVETPKEDPAVKAARIQKTCCVWAGGTAGADGCDGAKEFKQKACLNLEGGQVKLELIDCCPLCNGRIEKELCGGALDDACFDRCLTEVRQEGADAGPDAVAPVADEPPPQKKRKKRKKKRKTRRKKRK